MVRTLSLRAGAFLLLSGVVLLAVMWVPPAGYGLAASALLWPGWLLSASLLVLVAAEAFELVEIAVPDERIDSGPQHDATAHAFVSLHVPICAEPPDVVRRTLLALHALRYERFEVLVVDNNTADESLWRPIELLCRELGPRFRFFHLGSWPGYKAGALNFALSRTSQEASIVGVIDADYEVNTGYLGSLTPYFCDPRVAFVQAPQNYREWEGRRVARMCYWEYWQFFAVSMRIRQQRNAILMHGTMVLIRKTALLEVGGWSEWCLTEDSELGFRLLGAGYRGVYREQTYGLGLVPFSYADYQRQRERWVTGGIQILKKHWRLFLPWQHAMTTAQKLHYLQGWAPWMRDAVLVASAPLILVLSILAIGFTADPRPVAALAYAILTVAAYLAVRQVIVYRLFLRRPWMDGVAAGIAMFGLVPTVGSAWIRGHFRSPRPFQRTPKQLPTSGDASPAVPHEAMFGIVVSLVSLLMLARFGLQGALVAAGLLAYAGFFFLSAYVARFDGRSGQRGRRAR